MSWSAFTVAVSYKFILLSCDNSDWGVWCSDLPWISAGWFPYNKWKLLELWSSWPLHSTQLFTCKFTRSCLNEARLYLLATWYTGFDPVMFTESRHWLTFYSFSYLHTVSLVRHFIITWCINGTSYQPFASMMRLMTYVRPFRTKCTYVDFRSLAMVGRWKQCTDDYCWSWLVIWSQRDHGNLLTPPSIHSQNLFTQFNTNERNYIEPYLIFTMTTTLWIRHHSAVWFIEWTQWRCQNVARGGTGPSVG